MNRTQWMEDFQKNISELIAKSPAADIERNVRSMMTQAFTRMDLVTREEFDVQADMLARARTKVDQLSEQLRQLQSRLDAIEAGKTTAE
jgi:BMFP domain-containing protein YqiC